MKKKVIALALVVPLIFMFTVFSAINIVSIVIPIPVSSVKIVRADGKTGAQEFVYSSYQNDFRLNVEVLPVSASDKSYTVKAENIYDEDAPVQRTDPPIVSVDENGFIRLHDVGRAMLTVTTNDGGYKDQMEVIVTTARAMSMSVAMSGGDGDIEIEPAGGAAHDYEVTAATGNYEIRPVFYPVSNVESVVWSTSDANVAEIDSDDGELKLRSNGVAFITCETVAVPKLRSVLRIGAVSPVLDMLENALTLVGAEQEDAIATAVAVEGQRSGYETVVSRDAQSAEYAVETLFSNPTLAYESGAPVKSAVFTPLGATETPEGGLSICLFSLKIEFEAGSYDILDFNIVPLDRPDTDGAFVFTLVFTEAKLRISTMYGRLPESGGNAFACQYYGDTVDYIFKLLPANNEASFDYRITLNADAVSAVMSGNKLSLTHSGAKAANGVNLWFDALIGQGKRVSVFAQIKFYHDFSSLSIDENSGTWGRAGRMAVGERKLNGAQLTDDRYSFTLSASKLGEDVKPSALGLKASVTGVNTVKIESAESGLKDKLTPGAFDKTETVKITVTEDITADALSYFKRDAAKSASVTFTAVKSGVNIYSSPELFTATKAGYETVLMKNVLLLEDKATVKNGKKDVDSATIINHLTLIDTTYDWSQAYNTGAVRPKVSYILEFKKNLYGNGKIIDASLIIMSESLAKYNADNLGGQRYFNGPLPLIGIAGIAEIWAQDNISYLVRTDGVAIDNVELIGVADGYLKDENTNTLDISRLNNAGTVLEIMSDASVTNSYVRNGRNGVRVYGRENPFDSALANNRPPVLRNVTPSDAPVNTAAARIYFRMGNCVLSRAREFLYKQGSNVAYAKDGSNDPQELPKRGGGTYNYKNRSYENDTNFYNDYVLVDSTIKNCVFEYSGLFAIGIESHFAGPMLNGEVSGIGSVIGQDLGSLTGHIISNGWDKMVATSYATVLRLEGDIRIYEWKGIDNIDSSSLIQSSVAVLQIDIKEMIKTVVDFKHGADNFDKILHEKDGKTFVHGGITLYGGGKNYSWLDMSKLSQDAKDAMQSYSINIGILENSANETLRTQGKALPYAAGPEDFRFYLNKNNGTRGYDWQDSKNYEF